MCPLDVVILATMFKYINDYWVRPFWDPYSLPLEESQDRRSDAIRLAVGVPLAVASIPAMVASTTLCAGAAAVTLPTVVGSYLAYEGGKRALRAVSSVYRKMTPDGEGGWHKTSKHRVSKRRRAELALNDRWRPRGFESPDEVFLGNDRDPSTHLGAESVETASEFSAWGQAVIHPGSGDVVQVARPDRTGVKDGVYSNPPVAADLAWRDGETTSGSKFLARLHMKNVRVNAEVFEGLDDFPLGVQSVRVCTELLAHLQSHAAFRKRTLALRLVLRNKAIKWCQDIHATEEWSMRQSILCTALAMVPSDQEMVALYHMDSPQSAIRFLLVNGVFDGRSPVYGGDLLAYLPDLASSFWLPKRWYLRLKSAWHHYWWGLPAPLAPLPPE
jgi:hypothetical protein